VKISDSAQALVPDHELDYSQSGDSTGLILHTRVRPGLLTTGRTVSLAWATL